MANTKKYWLMKSEPETYSIDHLIKEKSSWWTGVRNYQARNLMREMQVGDLVLFYHSSCEPPGIAGIAQVSKAAGPDPSQFEKKLEQYDPKASPAKPIWFCVEVKPLKKFKTLLALDQLRREKVLKDMLVLRKGQRLSVQPVTEKEFLHIEKMGG